MSVSQSSAAFCGVPSFFRGACRKASQGGGDSYEDAGYNLARHIATLIPHSATGDEWDQVVGQLVDILDEPDAARALAWFQQHMPLVIAEVPPRRRASFVAGVRRRHGDEGLC